MHLFVLITFICLFRTCMLLDENGDRGVIPDYGFIGFLFSKQNESVRCTGAIVAESWILNYCEYGDFVYDYIRVGTDIPTESRAPGYFIYPLVERITHPDHTRQSFPQINNEYDLEALYASKDSLFLDRTGRAMILKPEDHVWAVVLSRETKLPEKAYAHFFPKADSQTRTEVVKPRHRLLNIVNNSICDDHFQQYNLAPQRNVIQYCVNSSTVTFDDCCENNAIMEKDKKLIGILAWSTACWNPPEPWVFTNLGWYYDWITNITSDGPIFSKRRTNKDHKD